MMRTCLLLSALVFVSVVLPPPASGQPTLQPADTSLVRVASALAENGAAISTVWANFWPEDQAFLALRPTETALLVTSHPPQEGYAALPPSEVPASLHGRAYLRDAYPQELGPRTFNLRYALGRDTIPALQPKGDTLFDRLDFYVHESFHGYQRARWTQTPGDTIRVGFQERLVDSTITSDPAFRAQGEVGRRLLTAALGISEPDSLRALMRRYLAVRHVRTEGRPRVRAVERSMERREGTATYVGCYGAARAAGAEPGRGLACIREHVTTPIDSLQGFPEADARLMRWRQYGTGAALCVVLDRLDVENWQSRVSTGTPLDVLAASAAGFEPKRHSGMAQRALQRFGYDKLLRRAEK